VAGGGDGTADGYGAGGCRRGDGRGVGGRADDLLIKGIDLGYCERR
jgi:hypothetical protein